MIYLKEKLPEKGILIHTAGYSLAHRISGQVNVYVSLGILANHTKSLEYNNACLQPLYIMEPSVGAPYLHREIRGLSSASAKIYVHNASGVGYEDYSTLDMHSVLGMRDAWLSIIKQNFGGRELAEWF